MALRTGLTNITTSNEWEKFFLEELKCSPDKAQAYSHDFVSQDITSSNIVYGLADPTFLNQFNLSIGHQLEIRSIFTPKPVKLEPATNSRAPSNKPHIRHQPPQLKPSMTPSSFRGFVSHWTTYKGLVGLPPGCHDASAHIFSLACADHPQIRQTIADHNPEHLALSEKEYLEMIRNLLTARASTETYRNKFFSMTQNPGETCQQWLQRLQEVTPDCEFCIPCNRNDARDVFHTFEKNLLRSKFILGMYSTNIKQDLLAKSSQLKTLDAIFNHATLMEATARDLKKNENSIAEIDILDSSTSEDEELNRISSYRKLKKSSNPRSTPRQTSTHKDQPCSVCGSSQHGSSDRSSKCPAFKKTCNRCGKRGHFGKVCRSASTTDCANALIASIKVNVDTSSEIEVMLTPTAELSHSRISIRVFPDTGATLCVAGPTILTKLGLKVAHLKAPKRRIATATGGKINCIGKFQTTMTIGNRSTIQEIFVCKNIQRLYLSREGCIALGIVHEKFPQPLDYTPPPESLPHIPTKPTCLPYPPTEENIPKLAKWLLKAFRLSAFNNNKNEPFPAMKGVPKAHIHLPPKAKPYFRATPNQIPHFWRNATKDLIDQFVKRGIIRKSPIGRPTLWCFPMVITPKKSNTATPKLRMTVDFQHLNSQCIRELHHVEPPFKLASQIPRNTYKTILDAVDGYQAIELDEESQPLTTFITQWGQFYFLRLPAGLIDSGDKYTSRYDQVIQHIPNKVKCVDDTLLYDYSISDAFFHTFDYLQTCANHGIVLNADKFKFCQKEITFAGFNVTPSGIKPSDSTLQAIREFPTPNSTTDVRSWFGLVRQVSYAYSVSEDLAPLRCLLQHEAGKKPNFVWSEQLQLAFDKSKKHVASCVAQGIETFDPERLTSLQCDWSKTGIGFLLLQKHCACDDPDPNNATMKLCCESGWKTVYAGSRFTNPAESRYAPTEGEALAVAWALRTSRLFTLGCPNLYVVTDHKPLLGILNETDLGSIRNPRIRRLKEHTLDFDFTIKYCPGKLHAGADALSRYPAQQQHEISGISDHLSSTCESAVSSAVDHAINSIGQISDINADGGTSHPTLVTLDKLELNCLQDPDYMELHRLVSSGFPDLRNAVPSCAKLYWPLAQEGLLSTYRNIVLYQERLVIPKSLRPYIIQVLHSAHQGCTGMISRATTSVYWPGMRKEILSHQTNCQTCTEISPSQAREPLSLTQLPQRPFQVICSDIFQLNNRFYLIVVDRFSGFLHIFYSRTPPTHKFIEKHLRDIFAKYGRPEQLDTDGGPQFQSTEFAIFLNTWSVKHRLSSPYYPQSNGRAELGVKTAKRLLRNNTGPDGSLDNDKVACAVLQYHNTPLQNGPMSPAQLLFGRALADFLPVNPKLYCLHPYWAKQIDDSQSNRLSRLMKTASKYNLGTKQLQPLNIGQSVVIQDPTTKRWNRFGVVLKVLPHRKYQLRLDDTGNTTFRNRRFLKPKSNSHAQPHGLFPRPSPGLPILPQHMAESDETTTRSMVNREDSQQQSSTPDINEASQSSTPTAHHPQEQSSTHSDISQSPTLSDTRSSPEHQIPTGTGAGASGERLALRRLRPYNHPGLREQS